MARDGYEGATIPSIAKEAGLAPGLVHYHFKDKLEILVEVATLIGERALSRIDEASAGDELSGFIEALLGRRSADAVLMHGWLVLGAEATRHARARTAYQKVVDQLLERLVTIVRARTRRDAATIAAAIFASIQGYFVLAAASPKAIPRGTAVKSVRKMAAALIGEAS